MKLDDGSEIINVIKLNSNNVNTMVGSYSLGTEDVKVTYKQNRKHKKLVLFLGNVKIDTNDEDIDRMLSKFRLVEVGI